MWSDILRIRRSGKELAEASGRPSTVTGAIARVPADLAWSAGAAEAAARQAGDAAGPPHHIPGGLPGWAVLRGFRSTGEMVGFQPVGILEVDVHLDGREPYAESVRMVIPYERLTFMTHGRRLRVTVDPADRTHMLVDWSA